MGSRNKRVRQGGDKPVGNTLKALARQARAEEHGGSLPAPRMTVAAPGTSRKVNDRKRRTRAGHGK